MKGRKGKKREEKVREGKRREEKGRLLEHEIERHIERQATHMTGVFKWNHVIHFSVDEYVFILENFQTNGRRYISKRFFSFVIRRQHSSECIATV